MSGLSNSVKPSTWSIVKMPQPIFSHSRLTATNRVQNWHGNYLADKYGEEGSLGKSAGSDMFSFCCNGCVAVIRSLKELKVHNIPVLD